MNQGNPVSTPSRHIPQGHRTSAVDAEPRVMMLRCQGCGAHFPHGAWEEHLKACRANTVQVRNRDAEILQGVERRLADGRSP